MLNFSFHKKTDPVSKIFGCDRGQPIDRYYIEEFLAENSPLIKNTVLEIADSNYTKKFGENVKKSLTLHVSENSEGNTIVGDLSKYESLPENVADCFICTQTFHVIYDFMEAIKGSYKILKPNGILLATVPGISQISRYDMDRWGDYWRFTTLSTKKIFSEIFGEKNVTIDFHGNCLSACSFLQGLASHELTKKQLDVKDKDYQMLITVVAKKTI